MTVICEYIDGPLSSRQHGKQQFFCQASGQQPTQMDNSSLQPLDIRVAVYTNKHFKLAACRQKLYPFWHFWAGPKLAYKCKPVAYHTTGMHIFCVLIAKIHAETRNHVAVSQRSQHFAIGGNRFRCTHLPPCVNHLQWSVHCFAMHCLDQHCFKGLPSRSNPYLQTCRLKECSRSHP